MEIWFMIIVSNMIIIVLLFYSKIYIALRYKRDGSNDCIAVEVYSFRRLLTYRMEVPMINMTDIKNALWFKNKIKASEIEFETNIKREERFVKKNPKFYIEHAKTFSRIVNLVDYYAHLYCHVMNKFIKTLHCEQLEWKTIFGSEDAELTGIGTGLLWTIKSLMITRLRKNVIVTKKPIFYVKPIFGKDAYEVDFQCIFSLRFGNVINAMRILYQTKQ